MLVSATHLDHKLMLAIAKELVLDQLAIEIKKREEPLSGFEILPDYY